MKYIYARFILIALIFMPAQVSVAQQSGEIRAYYSSKAVLRQNDPVIVRYDLPVFMNEEFYPDFVKFGISIRTFGEDYSHYTSDPAWDSFMDPDKNYQDDADPSQSKEWLDYQQYLGPLKTSFTQPMPSVGSTGSIKVSYDLPRYLPPLGRSYTIVAFGEGGVKQPRTFLTHDAIKKSTSIGHLLLFGPEPKGEVKTNPTNPPGAQFYITISNANTLVDKFGDLCVLSLYHAGRVHLGGATEGDWLLDRRVLMKGQTEYALDPNSPIRQALPYKKPYDSYLGPHLVELWCRGVLVDQKVVLVDLPATIKLVDKIDKKPSKPPELARRLIPKEPVTFAPVEDTPSTTIDLPLGVNGDDVSDQADKDSLQSSNNFVPYASETLSQMPPEPVIKLAPGGMTPMENPNPASAGDLADYLETLINSSSFSGDKKALEKQIKTLRAMAKNGGYSTLPPMPKEYPGDGENDFGENDRDFEEMLDLGDPVLETRPDNGLQDASSLDIASAEADLNKPISLYRVTVEIDDLPKGLWKYLAENTALYAIPAGVDFENGTSANDYIVHVYTPVDDTAGIAEPQPAEFWVPAGQYTLLLGWDGDKGVRRRITLARSIITVIADEKDVARGRGTDFDTKTAINEQFKLGDIEIKLNDPGRTFYPGTERKFILTAKADFSNYDLHYQIKQEDGFLLGCLPYEWLADEEGRYHTADSFQKLYLGRDHPLFGQGDLSVASLLDGPGATQKISVRLPYFSGHYVLSVYATRKNEDFYPITPNMQKLATYNFTVRHPTAKISFPKGDHFTIKGSYGIDVNVTMPVGVADGFDDGYRILNLGMDGFLKEKSHLDPNKRGRKGYRADYFYMREGLYSKERTARLLKASYADVYYANHAAGTLRQADSKRFTSGKTFTVAPAYSQRSAAFSDFIVVDKFGTALARKRAYWNPWGSADYLKAFYFASTYPTVLLPQEPSATDWIEPDDRLRKRAVWAPDNQQCKVPVLSAKLNIAFGAADEAIP